jgi:hypothetical protein
VKEILSSTKWHVLDRGAGTVIQAVELAALHHTSFWDALIAACMLDHGIHTIVTENERDFRKVPGLTVINPSRPNLSSTIRASAYQLAFGGAAARGTPAAKSQQFRTQ